MSAGLLSKISAVATATMIFNLVGCSSPAPRPMPGLAPEAVAGREVAISAGCASCHNDDGSGRVGPKWTGLADSQVTLSDGTVITADDTYLYQSIKRPGETRRRGTSGTMPTNRLTDEQIAAIIVFIRALK